MTDLKQKIISASKWSALTEITSKAISPLVFVVLARLLTPEDFGVVAAASLVLGFSQIFSDAGLSSTLIQTKEDKNKVANIVFWGNLLLTSTFYLILFFSSDWIANVFKDFRISDVLKVQSTILIINGLSATHAALFKKDLNFKKLFWVRLFTIGAPGLASIPLAYCGFGYWALVAGTLVGAVIQVPTLWFLSSWRPSLKIEISLLKKVFTFSGLVTIEGMLSWFFNWGDAAFVGAFLSTFELGLFRVGNSFVIMIFGFILSPLLPVLYSSFSSIRNDTTQLNYFFEKANKIIWLIALPTTLTLVLMRHHLEYIIFGENWSGVSEVILYMSLMIGLSWLVGSNYDFYRAVGKPKINIAILVFSLPIYIFVYYISINNGLNTFLIGRLSLALLMIPVHALIAYKLSNFNFLNLLNQFRPTIFVLLIIASIGLVVPLFITPIHYKLYFLFILLIIMLLLTYQMNKQTINNLLKILVNRNAS